MSDNTRSVAPKPPDVSRLVHTLCAPLIALKRAFLRRRLGKAVFEQVLDRYFIVWPGVFNPVIFRTGRFLAEFVAKSNFMPHGEGLKTALDIGTGCGVIAIFAALRGYKVTATNIVPEALSCARANALLNGVPLELHQSDLFAKLEGRQFDIILFSLPKFRGPAKTAFEQSWRSLDVIDRLAAALPCALRDDGTAFFVLTSHGDCDGMLEGLARAGLQVERVLWRHFGVETLAIYAARHGPVSLADKARDHLVHQALVADAAEQK